VHKEQVTACVRVPGEGKQRVQHVEQFSTTVAGLLVLRDWLKAHGVTRVSQFIVRRRPMPAALPLFPRVWACDPDLGEIVLR